ncbi:hypothetical protein ACIQV1_29085 [Streptomyces rubiginosohelvolus]|uniref:hypothetical protein n=1 Tax=Streptomyces rubiginosohelvolus TaxID=67362 RepID=UPI00380C88E2
MIYKRPVDRGYLRCGTGDGENPDTPAFGKVPEHEVMGGDPCLPTEPVVLLVCGARPPTSLDQVNGVQLGVLRNPPLLLQLPSPAESVMEKIVPPFLGHQQAGQSAALVGARIIDVAEVHLRKYMAIRLPDGTRGSGRDHGVTSVKGDADHDNTASQHVMTAAGMRQIGEDERVKYYAVCWSP